MVDEKIARVLQPLPSKVAAIPILPGLAVQGCSIPPRLYAKRGAILRTVGLMSVAGCGGDNDVPLVSPAEAFTAATSCESIRSLQLQNVVITAAEAVPADSYQPAGSTATFSNLPAFCRVTADLMPVPGSKIGVELWLPTTTWNGRYQQLGQNGWGTAFSSYWVSMAPHLRNGYAIAITDGGRTATALAS